MDNTTNSLAEKSRLRQMIDSYGVPRMIITGFLLLMFVLVPFAGVDFATQISNVINRFSWNAIMVLAMVPMVHSGCGLNFGLPLGIISGLLGATLSIELGFTGAMSFVMAIVIATPFALLLGGGYGWLLNKIKGGEMMVATYVGFSSVSFMCMMWLLLPYKKPEMVWGFSGSGLRTTISLEGFYDRVLADILSIDLNPIGINLVIPTGSLIFFAILAFLMWAFLHTKTGTAMTAVGSNPSFAKAAGVSIDKMRLISVVLSTWLGAVGILVYEQGFGFIQIYTAPLKMAFPAVAAILIGGAAFGLFHGNLNQTLYAFVLGAVFSAIVLLTNRLRYTIGIHMLINGISVLTSLVESDLLDYLLACVILFSICFSVVLFFVRRKHYTLEPGPLPFSRAEKAHACFTSPWVWVLLVGSLLFSGVSIFL